MPAAKKDRKTLPHGSVPAPANADAAVRAAVMKLNENILALGAECDALRKRVAALEKGKE